MFSSPSHQNTYVITPTIYIGSAGIGRTGTFIAIDILIHQAQAEGMVDILKTTCKLREQRMGMIQTQVKTTYIQKYSSSTVVSVVIEKIHVSSISI